MFRSDSNLSENSITSRIAMPFRLVNTEQSTLIAACPTLVADDMDSGKPFDTYAKRLNWLAVSRGLSVRGLSIAAKLSPSTLGNLIRDERDGVPRDMDGQTARALAAYAHVSADWILFGKGSPDAAPTTEPVAAPSPRRSNEARRRASRELVQLDGIDEKEAAFVVQNIDLAEEESGDAMAYYSAARRQLQAPESISHETLSEEDRDISPSEPLRRVQRKRK